MQQIFRFYYDTIYSDKSQDDFWQISIFFTDVARNPMYVSHLVSVSAEYGIDISLITIVLSSFIDVPGIVVFIIGILH